jgi:hypothetical protein
MTGRMYTGTAGRLCSGDPVPPGAAITRDPAEALAQAWRASEADVFCRVPFVYQVAERDGAHVIASALVITSQRAWRALGLAQASQL